MTNYAIIAQIIVALSIVIVWVFRFFNVEREFKQSAKMKNEFKRFGLEKAGAPTAVLELLGALGLLVGLQFQIILLISAGGLATLMFLGAAVRIKVGDRLYLLLPALFFMIVNAYIFFASLHIG